MKRRGPPFSCLSHCQFQGFPMKTILQCFTDIAQRRSQLHAQEAQLWTELATILAGANVPETAAKSKPEVPPRKGPEQESKLMMVTKVAASLHLSPSTLNKWRLTGQGPYFVKVGRRVFYTKQS